MASSPFDEAVGSARNRWEKYRTDPELLARSALADKLAELFAWGWISAPVLQSLAEAARQDGLSHPDIVACAGAGASGGYRHLVRGDG